MINVNSLDLLDLLNDQRYLQVSNVLFFGMAVKLAHFARNVKIVTRTPGVSFTGVLAINNCRHCKLFEGVTLESFTRN